MTLTTIVATDSQRPDINAGAGLWASRRIFGIDDGFEKFCSLTVLRDSKPIAAVIFHNWRPDRQTIEISAAGEKGWQSRRVLNEMFSLCFEALECRAAYVRHSDDNPSALENSLKVGFRGQLIPDVVADGVGEWLLVMKKTDWIANRLYKPK